MNKYMKAAKGLDALEKAVEKATEGFDEVTFRTLSLKDVSEHLMETYRRVRAASIGEESEEKKS